MQYVGQRDIKSLSTEQEGGVQDRGAHPAQHLGPAQSQRRRRQRL